MKYNYWLIFIITALGAFIPALNLGAVNIALPIITSFYNSCLSTTQWLISGYLLIICSFSPISGKLSDVFSRRTIYLLGFLIFTLSSLLCCFTLTINELIIFRILQGIGGALIMANNQVIIMTIFPSNKKGFILGITTTIVAFGTLAGPSLGGILIHTFGWRSVFFMNIPFGILAYIMGIYFLPKNKLIVNKQLDIIGFLLFLMGMLLLLFSLTKGAEYGWFTKKIIICWLIATFLLFCFYIWESRITYPTIDFILFKNKIFLYGTFSSFLAFLSIFISNILLPFYLQNQLLLSVEKVGWIIFVPSVCVIISSPVSGYLINYVNYSYLTTIGLCIIAAGSFMLLVFINLPILQQIIIGQILLGIGYGIFQSPNNYKVLENVPKDKIGMANGINSSMKNLGKIFGVVIATTISESIQYIYKENNLEITNLQLFLIEYRMALLVAIFFALIGAILSVLSNHRQTCETNQK